MFGSITMIFPERYNAAAAVLAKSLIDIFPSFDSGALLTPPAGRERE